MNTLALGTRIHEARRQKGLSSDKLAELCDVGAVHIRKIESGARLPSIQLLVGICNVLHVSPQTLLQDSLEDNELSAQMRAMEKLKASPEAQADMMCVFLKYLNGE